MMMTLMSANLQRSILPPPPFLPAPGWSDGGFPRVSQPSVGQASLALPPPLPNMDSSPSMEFERSSENLTPPEEGDDFGAKLGKRRLMRKKKGRRRNKAGTKEEVANAGVGGDDGIRYVHNVAGPPYSDEAVILSQAGSGGAGDHGGAFPDFGGAGGGGNDGGLGPNPAQMDAWYRNFGGTNFLTHNSHNSFAGDDAPPDTSSTTATTPGPATATATTGGGEGPTLAGPTPLTTWREEYQAAVAKVDWEREELRRGQEEKRRRRKEREELRQIAQQINQEHAKRRRRLLAKLRFLQLKIKRLKRARRRGAAAASRIRANLEAVEAEREAEAAAAAGNSAGNIFRDFLSLLGVPKVAIGKRRNLRYEEHDDPFKPLLDLIFGEEYGDVLTRREVSNSLTVWFKRSIFFLLGLAALTLSPGLFVVSIALAVVFETLLNVAKARNDYVEFLDTYKQLRRMNGLPAPPEYSYDKTNWRYLLGLPPDFWLEEETLAVEEERSSAAGRRVEGFRGSTMIDRGWKPTKFVRYRV